MGVELGDQNELWNKDEGNAQVRNEWRRPK
jgi:hypothetical protein